MTKQAQYLAVYVGSLQQPEKYETRKTDLLSKHLVSNSDAEVVTYH